MSKTKNKEKIIGFRPDHDVLTMISRAEKTTGKTISKILNEVIRSAMASEYAKKREAA